MRRPHPLLCYTLVASQLLWGALGCSDSIGLKGSGSASTSASATGQSFGLIVFGVLRAQLAADAPSPQRDARLASFDADRDAFIRSLEHILNVQTLAGVQQTSEAVFQLVDDGTLPTLTAHIADTLELLAQDPQALQALSQLLDQSTPHTLPTPELIELLGRMFNYPPTGDLWRAVAQLISENDGHDDQGRPNQEPRLVPNALAALRDALLAYANASPPSSQLTSALSSLRQDLTQPALIRGTFDFGPPEYLPKLDPRGLPAVSLDPATGLPYPPFADTDQDGLADATPDGTFLDANAQPLSIPTFGTPNTPGFDPHGRPLAPNQDTLYQYVDAKRTALAVILKLTGDALARDVPRLAHRVLETGLGPVQPTGNYAPGPILDIAWALLAQLQPDATHRALRALSNLIQHDPATAERLIVALADTLDATHHAQQTSSLAQLPISDPRLVSLAQDLLPLLDDIFESPAAQTSTAHTLVDTLISLRAQTPHMAEELAPLFTHRRVSRETSPDNDLNRIDEARSAPVDRSQGLTVGPTDNRSSIHQLLDLLARAHRCQLFGRSLAVWTLELMAGLSPSTVGSLASLLQNLPGFLTNLVCSGISQDIQALDALAQSGALDALLPVAKAFDDRNEIPLLVELLTRIQADYTSLLRPFEPDIATLLESGALPAFQQTLALADSVRDPLTQTSLADDMVDGIAALVDDDSPLTNRNGQPTPSRALLLLQPLWDLDRSLQAANRSQDLSNLLDALFDAYLARSSQAGTTVLHNGSLLPLLGQGLDLITQALPTSPQDRAADLAAAQSALSTALSSTNLPTLMDLVHTVESSPAKPLITRGLVDLLTPRTQSNDDIFGAVCLVLHQLLQTPPSPSSNSPLQQLAPFLATVLDPQNPLVPGTLLAFERLLTADQGDTTLNLLRAALNPAPNNQPPPAQTLIDIASRIQTAGSPSTPSPTTLEFTLLDLVSFIRDDQAGLESIYNVIRRRQ